MHLLIQEDYINVVNAKTTQNQKKMSKEDDFKFMLMWLSRNDYLSDDWQILWEEFIKDIKPKQR